MLLMVTPERGAEYREIVRSVAAWADSRRDIAGVAVVGSWARNEPLMDSDLDLVVLTTDTKQYLLASSWLPEALGQNAEVVRRREWGPLTEYRVVLHSGFEIESGFVAPDWASTEPLDGGTERVVRDGCVPLHDPTGAFEAADLAARDT